MTTTKSEIINKVKQNNYIFLDEYLDKESNRRVIIKDFSGYKYDIIINKLNRRNYSPNKFDVSMEKIVVFLSGLYIGSSLVMFFVVSMLGKGDTIVPAVFLVAGAFLAIVGFSSR